MSKDYYKTLGVDKNASEADIKSAFRKLAHQHHPDKNGGDDKKFKEVNEAYQTLSDKTKRAQYDQFGSDGPQFGGAGGGNPFGQGGGFGGFSWEDIMRQAGQGGGNMHFDFGGQDFDLGDIFGAFAGGGFARRGRSIEVQVSLTFKESIQGVTREVEIPHYVDGKKIGTKKVSLTIPPGVEHGQQLRMDGAGEEMSQGRPGSLMITVLVKPHPTLRKEGNHLVTDVQVSLADALLGTELFVETLDGKEKITIPECMPVGHIIKIKGKGVPRGFMQQGDLIVQTHITMPRKLSKKVKETIETLKGDL